MRGTTLTRVAPRSMSLSRATPAGGSDSSRNPVWTTRSDRVSATSWPSANISARPAEDRLPSPTSRRPLWRRGSRFSGRWGSGAGPKIRRSMWRPSIRVEVDDRRAAAGLLAPGSAHCPPSPAQGRSDVVGSAPRSQQRDHAGFPPASRALRLGAHLRSSSCLLRINSNTVERPLDRYWTPPNGRLHPSGSAL